MNTDQTLIQEQPREFEGRVSPGTNWREIVAWVSDLPPLPHVAAQAIALVEDPEANAGQITKLLGRDPALAARVLKIANSAMFSRQRSISTLNQAIMVIGFKALKGIIVAATLRQLNRKYGSVEKLIWANSVCTAIGANIISKNLHKEYADELFLYGLLHDLGKLVINRQLSEKFTQITNEIKSGKGLFYEVEQSLLGFSHPLIGALVAKKWNFSEETCQIILHHHDPLSLPLTNEESEKLALVQLANLIAHRAGGGYFETYPSTITQTLEIAQVFNLDEQKITELTEEISKTYQEQNSVFES